MKYSRYQILEAFCQAMEWAAAPDVVYQRFIDVSVEYFECDAAHLHLFDFGGQVFQHSAFHGDETDSLLYSLSLAKNVGRLSFMIENLDLIIMDDYEHPHAQDVIPDVALTAGFKSAVSIPLYVSSGIVGMLSLIYKRPLPWGNSGHDFLLQIGSVLGLFIQRIQMQKKDLELQVLRERKQLSSEIHDNLSQMISALAIRADIAQECLDEGDLPNLQEELKKLGIQSRQITKVLREEMLSLRTTVDSVGSVADTLKSLLDRFGEQWNIQVEIEERHESDSQISQYAMLQLIRIVNEALQNILRHSRASRVNVTTKRRNGHVVITIADNGIGFDVDAVAPERLGLRIMQERAEAADGRLSVESGRKGTVITLELPVIRA